MQAYHRLIHRTLAKVPGGFVTASSPRGAFLRTLRSTTPATCGGAVLAAAVALTLVARGSLSSVSNARAVASSAAMSSDDREAGLRSLWADAFDAWVDVPGDADDVIFASPVDPSALATHSTPSAPFPPIVTDSRLFALTAFNPMGEDRPIAENRAANERLARDIRALDSSNPASRVVARLRFRRKLARGWFRGGLRPERRRHRREDHLRPRGEVRTGGNLRVRTVLGDAGRGAAKDGVRGDERRRGSRRRVGAAPETGGE